MIDQYNHEANNHRRGMKADIWEGGHRVPFVARWPKNIKPGSVSSQTICLTDLYATAADITDTKVAKSAAEDSFSILPALLGKDGNKPLRDSTVHHSLNGTFAIRIGDWKLVEGNLGSGGFTKPSVIKPKKGDAAGQLYNLKTDPAEKTNLYAKNPDVVKRLKARLDEIKSSGNSRGS